MTPQQARSIWRAIPKIWKALAVLAVTASAGVAAGANLTTQRTLPARMTRAELAIDSLRDLREDVADTRALLVCYIRAQSSGANPVACIR